MVQSTDHDVGTPAHAEGFTFLGHSDQGGRADGLQVMVGDGHAYVGHMFSQGFTVLDVHDPRHPTPVAYVAAPPGTWNLHLQLVGDVLVVVNEADLFANAAFARESSYYGASIGRVMAGLPVDYAAGLRVFDVSDPRAPREIGFMSVPGVGLHRVFWTGGRWAYASALLPGFTDFVLVTIDMADPARPELVGRWWLPGQNYGAGETPTWDSGRWRYGLHHAVVAGDTAYAAWRDGGLTLLDVSDRAKPELVVHRNWSPPYGGGTHSCLPLPGRDLLVVADEGIADHAADGIKRTWVFDVRVPENPVSISTFPLPTEDDFVAKGGHFGPHNLHENRPGSFVSERLVFMTYENAGLRAYDLFDAYAPREVGAWVPPPPRTMHDPRPGRPRVVQTADVFVDAQGIAYVTDYNAGLYVLQYDG